MLVMQFPNLKLHIVRLQWKGAFHCNVMTKFPKALLTIRSAVYKASNPHCLQRFLP